MSHFANDPHRYFSQKYRYNLLRHHHANNTPFRSTRTMLKQLSVVSYPLFMPLHIASFYIKKYVSGNRLTSRQWIFQRFAGELILVPGSRIVDTLARRQLCSPFFGASSSSMHPHSVFIPASDIWSLPRFPWVSTAPNFVPSRLLLSCPPLPRGSALSVFPREHDRRFSRFLASTAQRARGKTDRNSSR